VLFFGNIFADFNHSSMDLTLTAKIKLNPSNTKKHRFFRYRWALLQGHLAVTGNF
jgi:hypothetical protein